MGHAVVPGRMQAALARGLLVGMLLLAPAAAAADASYRLVDHAPAAAASVVIIDGLLKRVLDPGRSEDLFDLPPMGPDAALSFAAGLEPIAGGGSVRFEIELELSAGTRTTLYQKELSAPGWVDERVSLPANDLSGVRLRLRRTLVTGPGARLTKSAWGDPVLLWSARTQHPSVILISIDTLRADRVGLYGYPSARTPALDALGRDGTWYAQAYSPSTWTVPSHASLLCGRFLETVPAPPVTAPAPAESLAEILRLAGHLTAGFTGGGYLSPSFSFHRGFDTYYAYPNAGMTGACPPERLDGEQVFRRATAWLHDRGRAPFFLFLHTYDAHDRCPFSKETPHGVISWTKTKAENRTPLLAYYDDLIAGVDVRLGAFFADLDKLGLTKHTIVVVTSDHGELFSEHGLRGHGHPMKPYEELAQVPLLFRYPAGLRPRGRLTEPVSLIDVVPTILSLLDLPKPPLMQGDVLPGLGLSYAASPRPVYVVSDDILTVREGALKLITSETKQFRDEAYDLERDHHEQINLLWKDPAAGSRLRELATARWAAAKTPEINLPELSTETKERLRVLGYTH